MKKLLLLFFLGILILSIILKNPSKTAEAQIFYLNKNISQFEDSTFFSYSLDIEKTNKYVYIIDYKNFSIVKLDSNLTFIQRIGHKGYGPGEFVSPIALSIDKEKLYVYDESKNSLIIFSLGGKFLKEHILPQNIGTILINFDILSNYLLFSPKNKNKYRIILINLTNKQHYNFKESINFSTPVETYGRNFWFTKFINDSPNRIIAVGKTIPEIALFKKTKKSNFKELVTKQLRKIDIIEKRLKQIDLIYKKRKHNRGFLIGGVIQDIDLYENNLYILPYSNSHLHQILYQYQITPQNNIIYKNKIILKGSDPSLSILQFVVLNNHTIIGINTKSEICLFKSKNS